MGAFFLLCVLVFMRQQPSVCAQYDDMFDPFPALAQGLPPVTLPPVNSSTRWGHVADVLLTHVAEVCGATRLCSNATRWTTGGSDDDGSCSPCQACSCDADCFRRGDCCADRTLEGLADRLVLQKSPRFEPAATYGCRSLRYYPHDGNASLPAAFALMIDGCPPGWSGNSLEDSCRLWTESAAQLVASWPVTSAVSKATYRNRFCALCHGEEADDLRRWDLELRCSRNIHLRQTNSLDDIVEQVKATPQCQLTFAPPEEQARRACLPTTEGAYVAACNASGERLTFDTLLWQACEALGQPRVRSGPRVYRNVFCFYCNTESGAVSAHCDPDKAPPFELLLTASAFPFARMSAQSKQECGCAENEVFDMYEDTCRLLHCSATRTLKDKQCLPSSSTSLGLAYQVSIILSPEDVTQQVALSSVRALAQVARNIRTAFLLKASSDSGWDAQIDLFRVFARVRNASAFAGETSTPSASPTTGLFRAETFLVLAKFLTRWKEASQAVEKRLLDLTRARWNISVGRGVRITLVATPAHTKSEDEKGFYRTMSAYKTGSDFMEFAVDIPDELNLGQTKVSIEKYEKVLATLVCPKVFFPNPVAKKSPHDNPINLDDVTGAIFHGPSGKKVGFEYVDISESENGVFVCAEQLYPSLDGRPIRPVFQPMLSSVLTSVSLACLSLSVLCLTLTLVTHCLLAPLRTPAGRQSVGVVANLLGATSLFEFGLDRTELGAACIVMGVLLHVFLLSVFAWLLLCAVRARRAFSPQTTTDQEGEEDQGGGRRVFVTTVLVVFVMPASIVAATMIGNYLASSACDLDLGYGAGVCFLSSRLSTALGAMLPICVTTTASLLLFGLAIRSGRGVANRRREAARDQRLYVHVKLTALTGVTWLAGSAAVTFESEILWCAFLVLCALHGLYVLVAFVCNARVVRLYRGLLCPWARREKTDEQVFSKEARGEEQAPSLLNARSPTVSRADPHGSTESIVGDTKL